MKSLIPFILLSAAVVSACGGGSGSGSDSNPTAPSANVPYSTVDVRVGTGAEATNGRTVTVRYAGYFYSATAPENKGSQFDAGTLPAFVLPGNLIQGFNMAIVGMRVNGLRRAVLPPNLAYGAQGRPPQIPGNSTLVFDIELLNVQ